MKQVAKTLVEMKYATKFIYIQSSPKEMQLSTMRLSNITFCIGAKGDIFELDRPASSILTLAQEVGRHPPTQKRFMTRLPFRL